MKKYFFPALALGAALTIAPAMSFAAAPQHHDAAHATYHFRTQDRTALRPHYQAMHQHVDAHSRWSWHRGANLPGGWHDHMMPLPAADIALLPPCPPGYLFGYYDGWAVVYDPNTGVILDAISVM